MARPDNEDKVRELAFLIWQSKKKNSDRCGFCEESAERADTNWHDAEYYVASGQFEERVAMYRKDPAAHPGKLFPKKPI